MDPAPLTRRSIVRAVAWTTPIAVAAVAAPSAAASTAALELLVDLSIDVPEDPIDGSRNLYAAIGRLDGEPFSEPFTGRVVVLMSALVGEDRADLDGFGVIFGEGWGYQNLSGRVLLTWEGTVSEYDRAEGFLTSDDGAGLRLRDDDSGVDTRMRYEPTVESGEATAVVLGPRNVQWGPLAD